jgi:hypothetical protein
VAGRKRSLPLRGRWADHGTHNMTNNELDQIARTLRNPDQMTDSDLHQFISTTDTEERYLADRMFPGKLVRDEAIQGLKTYSDLKFSEHAEEAEGNDAKAKVYALRAEYAYRDILHLAKWDHQRPAWLEPYLEQGGHLPLVEIVTVPKEGHYVSVDGRQWSRFDEGPEGLQAARDCKNTVIDSIVRETIEKLPPSCFGKAPSSIDRRVQTFEARMREGMEKKLAAAVDAYRAKLVEQEREDARRHQTPPHIITRQQQRGVDRGIGR